MTGLLPNKQGHTILNSAQFMSIFREEIVVTVPISFTGSIEEVPQQIINFNGTEERDIIGSGPATKSIGVTLSVFMGTQCTDRSQSRSTKIYLSFDFGVCYEGNRDPFGLFSIALYTSMIL